MTRHEWLIEAPHAAYNSRLGRLRAAWIAFKLAWTASKHRQAWWMVVTDETVPRCQYHIIRSDSESGLRRGRSRSSAPKPARERRTSQKVGASTHPHPGFLRLPSDAFALVRMTGMLKESQETKEILDDLLVIVERFVDFHGRAASGSLVNWAPIAQDLAEDALAALAKAKGKVPA